MNSFVHIDQLTRQFGETLAVDHCSLDVASGEVFGLLGPNGAGKSTTIKMLTTLLPPTSGTAQIAGFDIQRQAANVRRIISYVPQALSADGTLTSYENLLIFARLYDLPRREQVSRTRDVLDFMGLAEAADRLVSTYSGGKIRRLEVAQANPLSYEVDALRALMVSGGASVNGLWLDYLVVAAIAIALILLAARLYPKIVQ